MTCGYMRDVATANTWTFFKLLFRWNGSVWKAIHVELIIWLCIYFNIRIIYEFLLDSTEAARTYEHIVVRCREISAKCRTVMIFAIGFFVNYVSGRWWGIFMTIPWPDTCALQLTAFLRNRDKKYQQQDKLFRQNIMRYLWLSYVLVFRDVSVRIKTRFPTVKGLTPTLLTEDELKKLNKSSKEMRPWVPIEWIMDYLRLARRRGQIAEYHYVEINQTILTYRQQLHEILCHDSITVPLVYVQVVHICTICYFMIACFASQTIYSDLAYSKEMDIYIPVYAVIEIIVFVGWLKTAFVMLNPFGMDDDDFEMNALIERNLMVSLSYIEDFYDAPPELVNMKVSLPTNLQTAVREKANPMHGSAVPVKFNKVDQTVIGDSNVAAIIGRVSRRTSATEINKTVKPLNELADIHNKNLLPNHEEEEKVLKNPDNSSSGEDNGKGKKFYEKEDLEAAVAKLVDKRLAEEKMMQLSPQPQSTQKSQMEESTQKTWIGEPSAKSAMRKKASASKLQSHVGSVSKTQNSVGDSTRKIVPKPSVPNIPTSLPLLSPRLSPHGTDKEDSLRCEETQQDE